jgi:hypothetical protein
MQDLKFVALRTTGHLIGATLLWLMFTTWLDNHNQLLGILTAFWALCCVYGWLDSAWRLSWWLIRHIIIRPVTRVVVRTIAEERNR